MKDEVSGTEKELAITAAAIDDELKFLDVAGKETAAAVQVTAVQAQELDQIRDAVKSIAATSSTLIRIAM